MANVPKSVVDDAKRKAAELENFDCRKRGKLEIILKSDDNGTQTMNSDEDANVQSALRLLNTFKDLPIDTMTFDEQHSAMIELLA